MKKVCYYIKWLVLLNAFEMCRFMVRKILEREWTQSKLVNIDWNDMVCSRIIMKNEAGFFSCNFQNNCVLRTWTVRVCLLHSECMQTRILIFVECACVWTKFRSDDCVFAENCNNYNSIIFAFFGAWEQKPDNIALFVFRSADKNDVGFKVMLL